MKRLLLLLLLPILLVAQQPPPSVTLAWDTPPITSSLAGDWLFSSDPVNLTAIGVTDWINWDSTVNRKLTGNSQISNLTFTGTPDYQGSGRNFSWSDGAPVVADVSSGVGWILGTGNGYTFTAPADTVPRSLTVYLGVWAAASARITATLSADDPEPDLVYTDDIPLVTTPDFTDARNYIITYRASKPNQRLTIKFESLGGWIYLSSAALVQGVPDYYNVYRTESAGTYSSKLNTSNITSLTYTDSTVVRGRTYYYIARTANNGVESTNSNEVVVKVNNNVIVPPKPPGNLRVIIPPK